MCIAHLYVHVCMCMCMCIVGVLYVHCVCSCVHVCLQVDFFKPFVKDLEDLIQDRSVASLWKDWS